MEFQTPFGITACERMCREKTLVLLGFQTPFGITACESVNDVHSSASRLSFKRLSASLHVKELRPYLEDAFALASFKRLSASLHVKACCHRGLDLPTQRLFQTPFGITACERPVSLRCPRPSRRFKRLSASLHVKDRRACGSRVSWRRCFKRLSASLHVKAGHRRSHSRNSSFQTPFGITACER